MLFCLRKLITPASLCLFILSITLNKNAVHGDSSALTPGGVRLGAPALTSRSMKEADFAKIAEFLHRAAQLALQIQATSGKMLKDFVVACEQSDQVKVKMCVCVFVVWVEMTV